MANKRETGQTGCFSEKKGGCGVAGQSQYASSRNRTSLEKEAREGDSP